MAFGQEILEYCNINNVIEREQYYLDAIKPHYNIVEKAGSTLGWRSPKHTPESLEKMRNFVLSDEVRARKAISTINATAARKMAIVVKNINTNEISEYTSLTEAGKALGVSKVSVSQALLNNKRLKKTYLVTKGTKT